MAQQSSRSHHFRLRLLHLLLRPNLFPFLKIPTTTSAFVLCLKVFALCRMPKIIYQDNTTAWHPAKLLSAAGVFVILLYVSTTSVIWFVSSMSALCSSPRPNNMLICARKRFRESPILVRHSETAHGELFREPILFCPYFFKNCCLCDCWNHENLPIFN